MGFVPKHAAFVFGIMVVFVFGMMVVKPPELVFVVRPCGGGRVLKEVVNYTELLPAQVSPPVECSERFG